MYRFYSSKPVLFDLQVQTYFGCFLTHTADALSDLFIA
ncbi:hypothetical protein yfred0001_39610 [Yersinia frederiksenii ATCC 33641]|nr:hypothetical protein yfred0001_39610 [Yersinia frederiksenii ATCC 33641]